jgi:hypothetical protein
MRSGGGVKAKLRNVGGAKSKPSGGRWRGAKNGVGGAGRVGGSPGMGGGPPKQRGKNYGMTRQEVRTRNQGNRRASRAGGSGGFSAGPAISKRPIGGIRGVGGALGSRMGGKGGRGRPQRGGPSQGAFTRRDRRPNLR